MTFPSSSPPPLRRGRISRALFGELRRLAPRRLPPQCVRAAARHPPSPGGSLGADRAGCRFLLRLTPPPPTGGGGGVGSLKNQNPSLKYRFKPALVAFWAVYLSRPLPVAMAFGQYVLLATESTAHLCFRAGVFGHVGFSTKSKTLVGRTLLIG